MSARKIENNENILRAVHPFPKTLSFTRAYSLRLFSW